MSIIFFCLSRATVFYFFIVLSCVAKKYIFYEIAHSEKQQIKSSLNLSLFAVDVLMDNYKRLYNFYLDA